MDLVGVLEGLLFVLGDEGITLDQIVNLLEKFAFNEDERREAAKLLMFPEDALYDYDANLNGHEEIKVEESEPVVAVDTTLETEVVGEDLTKEILAEEETIAPKEETVETHETNPESAKGLLEKTLTEAGLNANQFSDKAITKILENYDAELIKKNVEILKNKNMQLDILFDNYELLYDQELNEKVEKLLEIGKEISDICMMPSVLVKYDLNGLKNTINVLQISGLDPKKVPLMAY